MSGKDRTEGLIRWTGITTDGFRKKGVISHQQKQSRSITLPSDTENCQLEFTDLTLSR